MGYFGIPFRNGVPIGLGSVASFGAQQFDPSSLFIGGTAGTWYDPSDPTTLFTTSAGTTPCAVPGSGSQVLVGLMLDKSQGAPGALGAELGASLNTAGAWTPYGSNIVSASGGEISITFVGGTNSAFGASVPTSTLGLAVGKRYLFEFEVKINTGSATPYINDGALNIPFATSSTTFEKKSCRFLYTGAGIIQINNDLSTGEVITFRNFSVRELPGNHAIAFNDTTARPELSARVNLLTYSEQFDNAAWAKLRASVAANSATAPDNTQTADTLVEDTTASNSHLTYNTAALTVANATAYIYSIYAKSAGRSWLNLVPSFSSASAYFDVQNGVVGTVSNGTASISSVGNGWFRCSFTFTSNATSGFLFTQLASANNVNTYTGDGTSGVFLWGADLRPANIGAAIPSYQRIADQYTYDSNGFPSYLRFDGVDDSMYTPASINFSGTDKMSVFAGVRKLSDAARGMVTELSAVATNPGTFYVAAPDTNGAANYGMYLDGPAFYQPVTYAAPITNVLAVLFDRSGTTLADKVIPRINGLTNQSGAGTNIASGNFGTYPLYIGSRNNASLRFNGHLYSLIIAGTQLQSGSITATEQYVAGKTGVQI